MGNMIYAKVINYIKKPESQSKTEPGPMHAYAFSQNSPRDVAVDKAAYRNDCP